VPRDRREVTAAKGPVPKGEGVCLTLLGRIAKWEGPKDRPGYQRKQEKTVTRRCLGKKTGWGGEEGESEAEGEGGG